MTTISLTSIHDRLTICVYSYSKEKDHDVLHDNACKLNSIDILDKKKS
jgi:hypothetical protein